MDFLPDTLRDLGKQVPRMPVDPILRSLMDIETSLTDAWHKNGCTNCPLGELAALAAAARTFYQETNGKSGNR